VGQALLIVGTDTDVGKTVFSTLLLAAARQRGVRALAMKPAETGCDPDPIDALTLAALAAEEVPLDDLCPYRFELPVAPQSAAAAAGARVELPVLRRALSRLQARADLVLVESAGGLGSPYGPDLLVLDLARELRLPVVLVARNVLGTVGQILMALRALQQEAVPCRGVVLCETTPATCGPEGATHAPLIAEHGRGVPVLGLLPHLAEPLPGPADVEALRAWAARQLPTLEAAVDLSALLQ
jgi:dethiobiotin synthetase